MKRWFLERFLPMWAKQTVLSDNRRLREENGQLKEEIGRLESYIRGLRAGFRSAGRKEKGK